jgi:serine protease
MHFRPLVILALLSSLTLLAVLPPHVSQASLASQKPATPRSVPGEILVRFREDASVVKRGLRDTMVQTADHAQVTVQLESLSPVEVVRGLRLARVAPEQTESAMRALNARPDVLYAEPNYLVHEDAVPNDTRYPEMYALNNTGQTGGLVGADIDAELAWNITTGSGNVVVGIIDSGIDINHPDCKRTSGLIRARFPTTVWMTTRMDSSMT